MLQRLIDDVKESVGAGVRMTTLAGATGIALLITTGFLCAAAFVFVQQTWGTVTACLTGAAVFFVVTLIAAGCYMVFKRQARLRAEKAAKAAARNVLADPVVVATGLQLVRAIGVKRLIPILAIGGLALGLMASRSMASDEKAEPAE
jgi:hypothetical protein